MYKELADTKKSLGDKIDVGLADTKKSLGEKLDNIGLQLEQIVKLLSKKSENE